MADFETQILESQKQVAAAQAKISEVTGRIEAARAKLDAGEAAIDIENATLDDVNKHTDVMNANIAELIMGLDDVTAGFSKDFDEMRSKTGMESFVGIFSNAKSESMRQERLRTASIDTKLQDLIAKSDVIVRLLQGQLDLLNTQKTRVEVNLGDTLTEREGKAVLAAYGVPLALGLSWALSGIGTFVPDLGQALPPAMSSIMVELKIRTSLRTLANISAAALWSAGSLE